MPAGKINNPTDKDGNSVDITAPSTGNSHAFDPVAPGYYTAVVEKLVDARVQMTYKGVAGYLPGGKWNVEKVTPQIRLVNDNETFINRGDRIVYYLDEQDQPTRPDGEAKDPIWGGETGALNLFTACGLVKKTGDTTFEYDFEYKDVTDRVVRVNVKNSGYIKATKKALNPAELIQLLTDVNGDGNWGFDEQAALVARYNEENGYTAEDGLRVNNVITWIGKPSPQDAEAGGYYTDPNTGAVFLTEASYDAYEDIRANGSTGATPW